MSPGGGTGDTERGPAGPRALAGGGSSGGGPGCLPAVRARSCGGACPRRCARCPGSAVPGPTVRNYLLPLRALCVSAGLPGGSGSRLPLRALHRRSGCHLEGKMWRRRSRGAARAARGHGDPRAAAMPGRWAPAPGRAAAPLSRFGAPRGVTPSTHQRHPARCPSRRARSQGRRASPDPPEPGPYLRAGRRCPH